MDVVTQAQWKCCCSVDIFVLCKLSSSSSSITLSFITQSVKCPIIHSLICSVICFFMGSFIHSLCTSPRQSQISQIKEQSETKCLFFIFTFSNDNCCDCFQIRAVSQTSTVQNQLSSWTIWPPLLPGVPGKVREIYRHWFGFCVRVGNLVCVCVCVCACLRVWVCVLWYLLLGSQHFHAHILDIQGICNLTQIDLCS